MRISDWSSDVCSSDLNGNAALQQVASAAEALQNTNVRLVEEFALAKRENDTMRQAVRNATGMEGGSDFIVGEAGTWQNDPQTSIGLAGVASHYVRVNLTSRETHRHVRKDLSVDEAIAYTNASGEACTIAQLGIAQVRT